LEGEEFMIQFHCKNCGQKIAVQDKFSGKKGKCPKCKNIVVVPKPEDRVTSTNQSDSGFQKVDSKSSAYDLTLLNVPPEHKAAEQPIIQDISDKAVESEQRFKGTAGIEKSEPAGKRKLPWIIDVFFYPISMPGIVTLGIIIILPLLINIAAGLIGQFGFFISLPGFVFIKIPITLYFFWYLAECVRDSALGGVRAPETLGNAPSLGDMFWHTLKIIGCFAVFAGPPGYYFLYTQRTDVVFWALLAYAVFFLPMGLLAVVIFDSFSALNPILLICSIFSTFFQYCGLVLILLVFALSVIATNKIKPDSWDARVYGLIIFCGLLYSALVAAHFLGRFYWRYEKKLNWDV